MNDALAMLLGSARSLRSSAVQVTIRPNMKIKRETSGSPKHEPSGGARKRRAHSVSRPLVEITLECDGLIQCPYCHEEIASNEREEEHGVCEHLVCIHLPTSGDGERPDFSKDNAFTQWWRDQDFPGLAEDRDGDSETMTALGYGNLSPGIARILGAYIKCPHLDCLIAQEDQGFGPCCGSIGPVLFGFRKNPGATTAS
jgi:hypothetical protein